MPRREGSRGGFTPSHDSYSEIKRSSRSPAVPKEFIPIDRREDHWPVARKDEDLGKQDEYRSLKSRVGETKRTRVNREFQKNLEDNSETPEDILIRRERETGSIDDPEKNELLSEDTSEKNEKEKYDMASNNLPDIDEEEYYAHENFQSAPRPTVIYKNPTNINIEKYDDNLDEGEIILPMREAKAVEIMGADRTWEPARKAQLAVGHQYSGYREEDHHGELKRHKLAERREAHRFANAKAAEKMAYSPETKVALERFERESLGVWNSAEDVNSFFEMYREEKQLAETGASKEDLLEVDTDLALNFLAHFSKDKSPEAIRLKNFAEEIIISHLPEDPNLAYVVNQSFEKFHFGRSKAVRAAIWQCFEEIEKIKEEIERQKISEAEEVDKTKYSADIKKATAYRNKYSRTKQMKRWKKYAESTLPVQKNNDETEEVERAEEKFSEVNEELGEEIDNSVAREKGDLARQRDLNISARLDRNRGALNRGQLKPVEEQFMSTKRKTMYYSKPSLVPKYKTHPEHFRVKKKPGRAA